MPCHVQLSPAAEIRDASFACTTEKSCVTNAFQSAIAQKKREIKCLSPCFFLLEMLERAEFYQFLTKSRPRVPAFSSLQDHSSLRALGRAAQGGFPCAATVPSAAAARPQHSPPSGRRQRPFSAVFPQIRSSKSKSARGCSFHVILRSRYCTVTHGDATYLLALASRTVLSGLGGKAKSISCLCQQHQVELI